MAIMRCDHCGSIIRDPITSVHHGGSIYCCANCAGAVEQGAGSSWQIPANDNELRCRHCGVAIMDESTMQTRSDDAFCCDNCFEEEMAA